MPPTPIASKVFSLLGVLPLGAFLALHLYVASTALRGEQAFGRAARFVESVPAVRLLEVLVIWLPLALHTAYGLYVIARKKSHGPPFLYSTRVRVLMRITAIVALAFIAFHAYAMRVGAAGTTGEPLYTVMAARLSSTTAGIPFVALFYLLGVAATVFHFSAGLWGAFVTWGWLRGARAKMVGRLACGALGLALALAGSLPVVSVSTGTNILGGGDFAEVPLTPAAACPAPSAE
jgi:succinate dehydrogenase/fumarate reductase cytochrome b subunit (b558 family)